MGPTRWVKIDGSEYMRPNRLVQIDVLKRHLQIYGYKLRGPKELVHIDSSKYMGPSRQIQIDRSK